MATMNREVVLKNFYNKLKEARSQNVRDVRLSLKEMEDIGYVLYELTAEYYGRTIGKPVSNTVKESSKENDEEQFTMDGGRFS